STVSRTFYVNFYFFKSSFDSNFARIFCSHLSSIRSVLFRTSESHFTCRRPRNNLTFLVCQRNDDVIKSSAYVSLTCRLNNNFTFFRTSFCHSYLLFSCFLFVSNSFLFTFSCS